VRERRDRCPVWVAKRSTSDFTRSAARFARALLTHFIVYRTYIRLATLPAHIR
jgi:maltooligosyltrehalose synthase